MPNDDQKKHPGEESHYNQDPQIPNDQTPPVPSSYTSPIANYPDQSLPNYPPPPVPNYPPPPPPGYPDLPLPTRLGPERGNLRPQAPERQNRSKIILVLSIVIVVLVVATGILAFTRFGYFSTPGTVTVSTTTPVVQPTAPVNETPTSASTPSPKPTVQSPSSNNYSAPHPGPGCDTSGGTWTPQGIGDITCATRATPASVGTWGYLYLQLPNNAAFSASNKMTVTGSRLDSYWISCLGLAEQDANAGFLAEYCPDGTWSINSISNAGTIIQTLSKSVTSKRTTTTISLALNSNTLSFTIDTESHQITVSPIQPIKVAIGFYNPGCGNCSVLTTNFSYITPSS